MTGPLLPSGRRPFVPSGLEYNGVSRDWHVDPNSSQFSGVSWVDEGVAMSALPRGSMKASASTGNTLHEIKYLGGPSMQAQVESAWRAANPLKRLVENGDVTIVRIAYSFKNSRLLSTLYYVNNRTKESRQVTSHDQVLETYG